ncbi:DUF4231 domain-containing protein [Cyanobium sp. N.Huapi 1H5]|uniref:DUF4231 domain-containing protein n=1 Tax=Cyanobium sp. N.Huapi 1H5 TaxID=2823719 RepID=UPI0020CBF33B|nr:DUF4231 domain-containing protein [Cyanobium sp. N.Huapi 1H5]MCP9839000.1 DUF4231 domain-containing protein [Cyanobium sp. N.Huapi 1H5]
MFLKGKSNRTNSASTGQITESYVNHIDNLELNDNQKSYLKGRWLAEFLQVTEQHRVAEQRYKYSRLLILFGSILVPAMISWKTPDKIEDLKIEGTALTINIDWDALRSSLAVIISLSVAGAAAIDDFFDFGERSRVRFKTKEKMESEYWSFIGGAGYYRTYAIKKAKAVHPDLVDITYIYKPAEAYDIFPGRIEAIAKEDFRNQIEILSEQLRQDAKEEARKLVSQAYENLDTPLVAPNQPAATTDIPKTGSPTVLDNPPPQSPSSGNDVPKVIEPSKPEPSGDGLEVLNQIEVPTKINELEPKAKKALAEGLIKIQLLEPDHATDDIKLLQAWNQFKLSEKQSDPDSIGPGSVSLLKERLISEKEHADRIKKLAPLHTIKQQLKINALSQDVQNALKFGLKELNINVETQNLQDAWSEFKQKESLGQLEFIGPGSANQLLRLLGSLPSHAGAKLTPKLQALPFEAQSVSIPLSGSVGKGGENNPDDVAMVRRRLKELGYRVSSGNTITNDDTDSIRLFQSIIEPSPGVLGGDGRVDKNGLTHQYLQSANAPHWILMPIEGEGYINIERKEELHDDHDYGTSWLAEVIEAAGSLYESDYRRQNKQSAKIGVNDASRIYGGDTDDHFGHECGNVCDFTLPKLNGDFGGIEFSNKMYDRSAARAMLKAFRKQSQITKINVTKILFNDPMLISEGLCTHAGGHADHFHVEIGRKELQNPTSKVIFASITSDDEPGLLTQKCDLLQSLKDSNELVAIAVGYSEGNRTLNGGKNTSFSGHIDPGNKQRNVGSFSSQVHLHKISNPEEADALWLTKLRNNLLPKYKQAALDADLDPNLAFLWLSACDLYVQSPAAVNEKAGLLDRFSTDINKGRLSFDAMVQARVSSYFEPNSGKLNAPGFGNNLARLKNDQIRRSRAIELAIKTLL